PFGPAPTVTSRRGVVSSADAAASRAGAAVLAEGGNAVDAAVATAFALAVTYPQAGNLAGGGFAVGRSRDGDFWALDFRETAPAGTWERTFLLPDGSPRGNASREGGLSVATPGTVRGLEELHRRLGRLPWARLVAPAVTFAREGFPVPEPMRADLAQQAARLTASPETRRIFFPGGGPVPAGELLRQPELAATLEAIARGGADAFHRGRIARLVAERVRATGGVLTEEDLASYRPVWRPPLVVDFGRWRLVTMPPPSAGGFVLMSILGQLAAAPADLGSLSEAGRVHLVAEAMKRALADRNEYVGDPDCVSLPLAPLPAPPRLAGLGASLRLDRATPAAEIRAGATPREGSQTTHFSVATADGDAVAVTYTLNDTFGNGDVVPGVGVLLNDEMDDFATQPGRPNLFGLIQGTANAVRAGARPVSSMSPTVVLEDGRPRFVLGSPGGSTIPSTVLEVFLRAGPLGRSLAEAVAAPRFHHQHLPDELVVERGAWPAAVLEELRRRGDAVRERRVTDTWGRIGVVHAISFERDGTLVGVADPRRYGRAVPAEQGSPR
ncbi:MAG TPA: gamma-glutamyltransferase, partial [Thermoanaerobaculia bacterium]|nr:gamma-glutamyltransferase [Thermoanaerobaculia bacterium]